MWVKYGDNSVFILALYEKLLTFSFRCGRVGHGETHCSFVNNRLYRSAPLVPTEPLAQEMALDEQTMELEEANKDQDGISSDRPHEVEPEDGSSHDYSPWLIPRNKKLGGHCHDRGCG